MKIFTASELEERKELFSKLSYDVSEYEPDWPEIEWDEDINLWIEFLDEKGNLYDGGDLTYYLQNDIPKEMYEEVEGIFTYTGTLSKSELEILLDNIFS